MNEDKYFEQLNNRLDRLENKIDKLIDYRAYNEREIGKLKGKIKVIIGFITASIGTFGIILLRLVIR